MSDNCSLSTLRLFAWLKAIRNVDFRKACERAVDFDKLNFPQSKPDCFFTGFAYYFLGRNELAKHYHGISLPFCTEYYDQLELKPPSVISNHVVRT